MALFGAGSGCCCEALVFHPPARRSTARPSARLRRVSEVESVFLNAPNLHFIPCNPVASPKFADDVYVATSEPHGNIEAVVTRGQAQPHCRL